MKAAVYTKYGPPNVVSIIDMPIPTPNEHEVLIKVIASTVNRTDTGIRSAEYFISRFFSGLFYPRRKILGCEFSGIITEVGNKVTLFKTGDHVFGYDDQNFGGHAEYLSIHEESAITTIPKGISFETAAAISEGAHYALVDIRAAGIQAGQHALVYGATGSIGSAAVQLLQSMHVKTTAVCNSANVQLIQNLGVHRVIDYEKEDFRKSREKYHFIFDAVGKSDFSSCKPLLYPKGVYISTELGKYAANVFLALITPWWGKKKVLFPIPKTDKNDIVFLKKLVEKGDFIPVIDRSFSLDDIVEAHKYVASGRKTGNVVINVGNI